MSSASSSDLLKNFLNPDRRTVIVPIDHGTAIPVAGLADTAGVIRALSPHADGFVVNYGVARALKDELKGKAICLRADVYKPANEGHVDYGAAMTYGAEEALRVGAHGVMSMLYPQHPNEHAMFKENARLISQCHAAGLPVIVESLPYGLGKTDRYTPENISFAVRVAAELGADIVKTAWPGDAAAFADIVRASFVPVILLGGASGGDELALLKSVEQSIAAGGAGIAIGRNVWQHPQPAVILKKLRAIVHDGATAEEAAALA